MSASAGMYMAFDRRCLQRVAWLISGVQLKDCTADEGAGDWNFIAILGLRMSFFEDDVGGFGGERIIECLTFKKLVGGLDLMRDV